MKDLAKKAMGMIPQSVELMVKEPATFLTKGVVRKYKISIKK